MNKLEYSKQWRIDNKEHIKEYDKMRYQRDKEKNKLRTNTPLYKKQQRIRSVIYLTTDKGIAVRRKTSKTWGNKNPEKKKQILRDFEKKHPENHRVRKVMSGEGSKTKKGIIKDIIAMKIYIDKVERGIIK